MSIGQTGSVMTVEEEIVRYLRRADRIVTLKEVLRNVTDDQTGLTQEVIEEAMKDLTEKGRIDATIFFKLI